MDFRVYHYGARGVFDGTRPVYGETSGLGWPMHYRYPPLFLLLFAPFAWMPLSVGAAVWVVLKLGVIGAAIVSDPLPPSAALPLCKGETCPPCKGGQPRSGRGSLTTILLRASPYVFEDFRYGNVQFFIFALTAAALITVRTRPVLSAASLALAISIKVWPLFFVPYLAVKREWKVIAWSIGFTVVLTLLPSLYFGFNENISLLQQWVSQEFQTQLGESEIWFPNQSLRGVLMRYLTVIDYSQVPDSDYPAVNFASMDPSIIRAAWTIIAAGIYASFLAFVQRRKNDIWVELGIGFCLLTLLEPFTQKYALVVLLVPAIAASRIPPTRPVRALIYASIALIWIQPLAGGAAATRLLQVLGMDFFATALLTIALAVASFQKNTVFRP